MCEIYFNNRPHCGGGIMALDGKTGKRRSIGEFGPYEIYSDLKLFKL